MYVLFLDTGSFRFIATGRTEKAARLMMARGWIKHCIRTGADRDHVNADEDGNLLKLEPGQCFRDGFLIHENRP